MSTKTIRLTNGNDTVLPESAESGNGYCKMADGTLICYGRVTFPAATAVGVQIITQNFPISFSSIPFVVISMQDNENLTQNYVDSVWAGSQTNKTQIQAVVNRLQVANEWYASYIAIGRWK